MLGIGAVGAAGAADAGSVPRRAEASRATDPAHALPPGIAWHVGTVDAAFATARARGQPLFLYWGAVWCPPCNQVKATLFNRQDFIARTSAFVPVYVDGDAPAAQQLAARFRVSGYPTMVLFAPDGSEITRLPGEVDPLRYLDVLTLALGAARPVKALLADAQRGPGAVPLSEQDWRLLAFYSWATDEQSLVPTERLPATLATLAGAAPTGSPMTARLTWSAAAAAADAPGAAGAIDPARAGAVLRPLLDDPAAARAHADLLSTDADKLLAWLAPAGTPQRAALHASYDTALQRLADDATLSNTDRLAAVSARIDLARLDAGLPADDEASTAAPAAAPAPTPALPVALRDLARREATRADRATRDRYERQSVISAAAWVLMRAGLLDDAEALLKAELARSPAPYYFMSNLARVARLRGDRAAALDWSERAWRGAQGPATRLQWGVQHVRALLDLAPDDAARIEAAVAGVLGELRPDPTIYAGRSARSLATLGKRLAAWNAGGRHAASVQRLASRLAPVCAKLPARAPERERCAAAVPAAA